VQFLSLVSLTPLSPNYKENISEWLVALASKGPLPIWGGSTPENTVFSLMKEVEVTAPLEGLVASAFAVAPYAIGGATLADALGQLQCALDPNAPLEGIPVAPK
jgi:hypothetical protein